MKRVILSVSCIVLGIAFILIPLNVPGFNEALGLVLIVSGIVILIGGIILISYNKKGEQTIIGMILEFFSGF